MPQKTTTITKIATWIAVAVAVVVAVILPLGYFTISYQYMVGTLETEAEIESAIISHVVSANPEMWQFEQMRLEELLARRARLGNQEVRRIYDPKGMLIAESVNPLFSPLIMRSYPLWENGAIVARVEISRSMRPILLRSALVMVLGGAIGLTVFIALRVLPLRAVMRAERSLQKSNEFLTKVMESSTNSISVIDQAGNLIMVNRRTLEINGYSNEELIGRSIFTLLPVHARPEANERFKKVVAQGDVVQNFETELLRKDGQVINIRCGAAPLLQEGEIMGIVLTAEDITERRHAEKELQRLNGRLSNTNLELQEINEEIKNFAYIVSHDLRAPLVSIKGFSSELASSIKEMQPLLNKCAAALDEKERKRLDLILQEDIGEALGFIGSSVNRMDGLIGNILNLSRLGRKELKPEPLDMTGITRAILASLAHQIEQNKVTVTLAELPELIADRVAMEQIMGNLLDNALKYLEPGRDGELSITTEQSDNDVTFHVRDNGRGIAEEDMHKVFELFRRAGKQDVPGDGMGLAYVKTLVRRHGGRIWCDSTPGVGSTFSFTVLALTNPSGTH